MFSPPLCVVEPPDQGKKGACPTMRSGSQRFTDTLDAPSHQQSAIMGHRSNIKGQALRASSQVLSTPPSQVSKTQQEPWPSWFQTSMLQAAPSLCRAKGNGQETWAPTGQPCGLTEAVCVHSNLHTFSHTQNPCSVRHTLPNRKTHTLKTRARSILHHRMCIYTSVSQIKLYPWRTKTLSYLFISEFLELGHSPNKYFQVPSTCRTLF